MDRVSPPPASPQPEITASNRSAPPSNRPTPESNAQAAQPAPATPVAPQAAANRPPERTVTVSVRLEPRPPSEMHRVISHIPLFGHIATARYREDDNDFQAPKPAHSLEPKVPGYMAENLKRPIDIDVLVSIDKSGRVKGTEVLEGAGTGFGSLAADQAASVQWEPARVGDKAVASQVVAHYHFRSVEREMADAKPEPQ